MLFFRSISLQSSVISAFSVSMIFLYLLSSCSSLSSQNCLTYLILRSMTDSMWALSAILPSRADLMVLFSSESYAMRVSLWDSYSLNYRLCWLSSSMTLRYFNCAFSSCLCNQSIYVYIGQPSSIYACIPIEVNYLLETVFNSSIYCSWMMVYLSDSSSICFCSTSQVIYCSVFCELASICCVVIAICLVYLRRQSISLRYDCIFSSFQLMITSQFCICFLNSPIILSISLCFACCFCAFACAYLICISIYELSVLADQSYWASDCFCWVSCVIVDCSSSVVCWSYMTLD